MGRRLAATIAAAVAACACGQAPCAFGSRGAPWLAFSSAEAGTWQIEAIRADGTCRRPLTQDGSTNLDAAWGGGGILAYDSDRAPGPGIWVHDVVTSLEERLELGDLRATSPAFSPDGATLAFEGRTPGVTTGAIYTVPTRGGTPTLLTPEAVSHGNGGPVFSPDGATIYFVSNRGGPYEVHAVPAVGGDVIQVTTGSAIVGKASVSPDGKTLAFARAAPGSTTQVVLYDLATHAITTAMAVGTSEPVFDRAGGQLAVRVVDGSRSHLALAPLDGSAALLLTTGPGPDGAPAFARNGE
jgi:TolB protein